MSSRAIQRLREERGESSLDPKLDEIEEEEEEDTGRRQTALFAMMNDSSESESEEEEEEQEEPVKEVSSEQLDEKPPAVAQKTDQEEEQQHKEEEDLDALLAEFESKDEAILEEDSKPSAPWFHVLVSNMDARDLDFDYVMRTSLLGGASDDAPTASRRSQRQTFLFGPPRDGWVRPPHYVGGGVGMTTYDMEETSRSLPWPYDQNGEESSAEGQWQDRKLWFTFVQSDTYRKDLQDYERIQESGDVNALALFVAHHPFVVEALLQLTMVLYRTNQSQEGLALLRRTLWILECSSISSFKVLEKGCFMDYDQPENASYFTALFRLIQISGMASCIRTSLAVSRYLLTLDPLRDPVGVLLLMDYFALASMNENHEKFLINLVESNKITLHYRDESSREEYRGELLDLPNWAYSYALALYRRSQSSGDDDGAEKCDNALRSAIQKFPSVVEELLIKNDVDVTGRSMRSDWPSVLPSLRTYANNAMESENYDPIAQHAASQTSDLIIKIFVKRNHALWSGDDVLTWLCRNCACLVTGGAIEEMSRPHLSPALTRYARCDPVDYEDRFQTLPNDANPLDPGLVAPALAVDPNRRRFLRRAGGPAARQQQEQINQEQLRALFGGPPTNIIDPDSPMMEVFWRSMLPWNRVDGLPPPRR